MAWDKGFNFRYSSGYVSDGTNETYDLGVVYPVTRNGCTFGWSANRTFASRDRDSTVDRRLAGIVQWETGTGYWRLDLPSVGTYDIWMAIGDTGFSHTVQKIVIKDTTTTLATINDTDGTVVNNYDDATGINRTEANWPSQNQSIRLTFASTNMLVYLGDGTNDTTIAHIFVSQVSASAAVTGPFPTFRPDLP